ncbi:thioredoxin [Striga asiatica]|uniref:Thioredoxin n=1 Tax=Striga asiatica TaxID=4170 RepID=A0A5A7R4F4_STRAF|nr:thioredoxin [Striga asiatica]
MQKSSVFHQTWFRNFVRENNVLIDFENHTSFKNLFPVRTIVNSSQLKATIQCRTKSTIKIKSTIDQNVQELFDEDDGLCPIDCVREFKTDEEFFGILEKAKEMNALVVVDFYKTSCGSCRYIEQGFVKLCKGAGDQEAPVIFLKHNVLDEYDERSEVAERLRIRTVPLFHFYKNGFLLEAFPTRDKKRILEAILKYTAPASQEVDSVS